MSNKTQPSNKNTLYDCKAGKTCVILRCNLDGELKSRLFEMGLVPLTRVTVTQRAPLGDPLQITMRGYSLCVRGNVAKQFDVEVND